MSPVGSLHLEVLHQPKHMFAAWVRGGGLADAFQQLDLIFSHLRHVPMALVHLDRYLGVLDLVLALPYCGKVAPTEFSYHSQPFK